MRYFEKNIASGEELIRLHHLLMDAFGPVANNLFFHEARDGDTPEHRETLAISAYNLIGICEAIIDLVPEEDAARALEECREHFEFDVECEAREVAEKIARILGRL